MDDESNDSRGQEQANCYGYNQESLKNYLDKYRTLLYSQGLRNSTVLTRWLTRYFPCRFGAGCEATPKWVASAFDMKTNIYVDGLNLYYGAVKGTSYKWLNLVQLCGLLLPGHHLHRIRYFTARVRGKPDHPRAALNQQIYLRALRSCPIVSLHYGHFLAHDKHMPLSKRCVNAPGLVLVHKTEEKGSDVNLATWLLTDAFDDDFECAVLITNDSDLLDPIRIVRQRFSCIVGLLNPHPHPSKALVKQVDFVKTIRKGVLRDSQFSDELIDKKGPFHKPADWTIEE